jgi:MoaA/NifB/PqqE/SkfB family radical SAM enzyme
MISWIKKFVELPIIHFETNLVNHCNLNCAYCDHISPLSKEWFADLNTFEKDIARMSDLFSGEARYIRLVGGEPLLHPDLKDFLVISRRFFASSSIEIWTNGILLSGMNDSFWNCCRENHITISVTKYPISLDYVKVQALAEQKGVTLRFFGNGEVVDFFNKNSFDRTGLQEPRSSFIKCENANRHITLSQGGNIYTCDKVPHVGILNDAFDEHFFVSKRDFINIHSNVSAEDIFRFLAKPIPFCRYCNVSERKKTVQWKKSDRSVSEWVSE